MSEQAKRVAWIGLGKLGLPMAARLANAGYQVMGYDLNPERMILAAERGVQACDTIGDAVASCPVVYVSVPDDRALNALALGAGDLVNVMATGTILVETSTVSIGCSEAINSACKERGIPYLRAPVSGNPVSAEAGQLAAMVSGPKSEFEEVQTSMSAFTKAQTWLGEEDQARFAKLAINLMIAVSAGMMGEALALARRGNLDWTTMLQLMAGSAIGSPMVQYKTEPLIERDFTSTFSCQQLAKDLDLILGCARDHSVSAPLAAQMREQYTALIAMGDGEDDYIAAVKHTERLSGLSTDKVE